MPSRIKTRRKSGVEIGDFIKYFAQVCVKVLMAPVGDCFKISN